MASTLSHADADRSHDRSRSHRVRGALACAVVVMLAGFLDSMARERLSTCKGAASAGNYVGKWGAAEELALGERKKGRHGRTPFQLLHDASETGDTLASELFVSMQRPSKVAVSSYGRGV